MRSGGAAAPEVYHQMHNHSAAQQSPAMYDQQQYMHIPFQDTANPMMIPIGKVVFEFKIAIMYLIAWKQLSEDSIVPGIRWTTGPVEAGVQGVPRHT